MPEPATAEPVLEAPQRSTRAPIKSPSEELEAQPVSRAPIKSPSEELEAPQPRRDSYGASYEDEDNGAYEPTPSVVKMLKGKKLDALQDGDDNNPKPSILKEVIIGLLSVALIAVTAVWLLTPPPKAPLPPPAPPAPVCPKLPEPIPEPVIPADQRVSLQFSVAPPSAQMLVWVNKTLKKTQSPNEAILVQKGAVVEVTFVAAGFLAQQTTITAKADQKKTITLVAKPK